MQREFIDLFPAGALAGARGLDSSELRETADEDERGPLTGGVPKPHEPLEQIAGELADFLHDDAVEVRHAVQRFMFRLEDLESCVDGFGYLAIEVC